MLEKPLKSFLIIVIILVGIGFITASFNNDSPKTSDEIAEGENGEKMVLLHEYFASANSYSGSIMTPSACYSWYSGIQLDDADPEQITLILTTTEDGTGDCEQSPSRKDFTFVVPSSPQAQLVAVELNGQPVDFEILGN